MEYVLCNLCRMDNARLLFMAKDMNYNQEGCFDIVKCRNCGLVYINPRPGKEEMMRWYPDNYYIDESQVCVPCKNGLQKKGLLQEKILKYKRTGKVLDIGCKTGQFLSELKTFGWDVYGVEISPVAAKYARQMNGLEVTEADFLETHFSNGQFDVVTLWQTLEHLRYPFEALLEIKRIIKGDGLLAMSFPNIDSFQARIFKDKWFHLDAPRHLFHFSPRTIGILLNNAGFNIQAINHFSLQHNYVGLRMSLLYFLRKQERHIFVRGNKSAQGKFSFVKFIFNNCCKFISIMENLSRHGGTIEVFAKKV